jgi:preprotein translocase subunit SecY
MTKELARRFAFTIGALLIFRLGSYIPIPGMLTPNSPLPGSALVRLSILSLNLVPYLSAAIIIQLVSMVWGRLSSLERSGEKGLCGWSPAFGGMLPYKFSGGSALIVVCTILDLQKQVRDVSLTNPGGERR